MFRKIIPFAAAALLAASPGRAAPHFNFGICPIPSGADASFAKAISRCQSQLIYIEQQQPEHKAPDYYALAQLYHFDRQYDLAVETYSKAVAWWHKSPEPYYARGDAYLAQGKSDLAQQDYATALALNMETPEIVAARCWLRAIRGAPLERALADCDAVLKADAEDGSTLFSRGLVKFRMGSYAPALADLDAALALKPKLVGAVYVRGLAKLAMNDASGNADIEAADKASPGIAAAYAMLGIR